MHYLAFGPTVQVMSTPWADSTVVLSAKVNCRPWVTVHFALGTTVLRNRILDLGIHVHTPHRHSKSLDGFILNTYLHGLTNNETQTINVINFKYINFKTEVCTVWVLLLSLVLPF